ncbi:TIGR04255 family protein [Limnohabitans sp.]|uniref:TIGR04255 family protein n=1 Tax=Limnohabitans sp. TaxID=1907725 RepID=UPI00286F5AA2|nr:TIGR04255 family protein [Limnohabitans sp.]
MTEKSASKLKARPEGLPDFEVPPLNEVVLGVQFATPTNYQQIHAGEVWSNFRKDYPVVQEHPPLVPNFETFGPAHSHFAMPPFSIGPVATHNRYWFLKEAGDELIQFQADRFLHNWRKRPDVGNGYPRYEAVIHSFKNELIKLEKFFSKLADQTLAINQCEITYINHFSGDAGGGQKLANWLSFIANSGFDPDDVAMSFREVIKSHEGKPIARLYLEINTAYLSSMEKVYAMHLTVRGAPAESTVESAIDFLNAGRTAIVNKFTDLTSAAAHATWKRKS